jgi:hypothetical protein
VIESGVYGGVRHPMFAGAIILLVGMPLWLESYAAAILASVPIGTLVVRIVVEEQFLRRALAGYNAYMRHYGFSCSKPLRRHGRCALAWGWAPQEAVWQSLMAYFSL